jgi:pseudaminic acid synthase
MQIDGRVIGREHSPYIIAEMSANHNGSLERAFETIAAAKRFGADAVKLQTYTADTITIDCDEPDFMIKGGLWDSFKLYDLYKWAETPFDWHEPLFAHARKLGITIFSTPFDETAVDLLERLNTPAYKISSFEIIDLPLICYVASTGKPMILSTGMASEQEIEEAVTTARDAGCKDLMLLHCISSYPAPMDQANLRQIPELAKRFNVFTGLSDHTMGTAASVAAVALGACLIEKHFTLSRADRGPDSEFSLEPQDLERLSSDTKDAWLALGVAGYSRQKSEEASKVFRRSVYFVKDLPAGHVIGSDDIRRIRPGMGLAPKHYSDILGLRLKMPVTRGTATHMGQFHEFGDGSSE